jgi:hypothetical protein
MQPDIFLINHATSHKGAARRQTDQFSLFPLDLLYNIQMRVQKLQLFQIYHALETFIIKYNMSCESGPAEVYVNNAIYKEII